MFITNNKYNCILIQAYKLQYPNLLVFKALQNPNCVSYFTSVKLFYSKTYIIHILLKH